MLQVVGAIAHFEPCLISECSTDGIAEARAKIKRLSRQPIDMKKADAALKLVEAQASPTGETRQLGINRSP